MSNSLKIQRGQSVELIVRVPDTQNNPVDLTGASWEVLENALSKTMIITFDIYSPLEGLTRIFISKDQTVGLAKGTKRLRLRINLGPTRAIALPEIMMEVV